MITMADAGNGVGALPRIGRKVIFVFTWSAASALCGNAQTGPRI